MLRMIQPASAVSAWAVKTAGQRSADFAAAVESGRDFFAPAGRSLSYMSVGAALDFDQKVAQGNGYIIGPDVKASTWVVQFGYWAQNGQGGLAIEFKSGAICWYRSLSDPSWYAALRGSPSAGKFIHAFIYKKVGYQLVSN